MARDRGEEVVSFERVESNRCPRDDRCGARDVAEQCDLPEVRAGPERRGLSAFQYDVDLTSDDEVETAAGVSLAVDLRRWLEATRHQPCRDMPDAHGCRWR